MSETTTFTVTNEANLDEALVAIDLNGTSSAANTAYTINVAAGSDIALYANLDGIDLAAGDSLTINGNGSTIDGQGDQRGLFVYAGDVTVNNLGVANAMATGGSGSGGGGGGAGLGGGLFVASGTNVTLNNVAFTNDSAVGGMGASVSNGSESALGGGGGGLGGSGGASGGGGGGIGFGAQGGADGEPGQAGIIPTLSGGKNGGGGAGSNPNYGPYVSGGYGGGIGGQPGSPANGDGGNGGFGGGGGGSGAGGTDDSVGATGGNGGFGGGAGGTVLLGQNGATGGFGGGGGGSYQAAGGVGGFGAGDGSTNEFSQAYAGGGGGGLGAGADVFVQQGGTLTVGSGNLGSGTVTAGIAGGYGATAGEAFGTGLFLQGDETVTLGVDGQSVAVAGTIADQTGNGGTGGNAGAGAIDIAQGSTVTLDAANTYTGGTTLGAGSTLALDDATAAGTGTIAFGGDATLVLSGLALANTIDGSLSGDDTIDLASLAYTGDETVMTDSLTDMVIVSNGSETVSLQFGTDVLGASYTLTQDGTGGTDLVVAYPCFVSGTRIATPDGEQAVETLHAGDTVRLATGGTATIRWMGHRRARAAAVIRIRAGSLPIGPHRDLCVSPDHALFLDGVLVPAGLLVESIGIVEEIRDDVTFHHVELEAHGILLADGAPAESYIDTGNRAKFGNCPMRYDPIGATQDHCAELILAGSRLAAIRARLALVLT